MLETGSSNAQIQTSGIFIGYRRADTAIAAATLCARLRQAFPKRPIFLDLGIAAGADYRAAIRKGLSNSRVSLILIGPRWLEAEPDSVPRILDPNDLVRFEVASALELHLRVIPVLVDGAKMPNASELPDDIKAFAYCQAKTLRAADLDVDITGLIETLGGSPHRKTRRDIVAISAILATSVLVAALSLARCEKPPSPHPAPQPSAPPTAGPSALRLENVVAIETFTFHKEKPLTDDETRYFASFGIKGPKRADVKYPFLRGHPDREIQDKINEYFKDQAGASEKVLDDADEVDTSFKQLSFSFNLLSIRIEISAMGFAAAHPQYESRVVNIDVHTGKPFSLHDLFSESVRESYANAIVFKSRCIESTPEWDFTRQFYVQGNLLVLLFQPNDNECPMADGITEIRVDINSLREFIRKDGPLEYLRS